MNARTEAAHQSLNTRRPGPKLRWKTDASEFSGVGRATVGPDDWLVRASRRKPQFRPIFLQVANSGCRAQTRMAGSQGCAGGWTNGLRSRIVVDGLTARQTGEIRPGHLAESYMR